MSKTFPAGRLLALLCVALLVNSASGANDVFVADKNTGCKVFKPNVQPNETVAWTGKCVGGMADGSGLAQWSIDGKPTVTFSGTFKGGQLQGKGTMTAAGGDRYEGDYKDGKRDGRGLYVSSTGEMYEGEYKNNQRDGKGVLTEAQSGRRTEGVFQAGVLRQLAGAPATPPPAAPPQATPAAQPSPSSVKTSSGAVFSKALCSSRVVYGVLPKGTELRTSTPSGQYPGQDTRSDGIFPVLDAAIRYGEEQCGDKAGLKYTLRVFLYEDKLPEKLVQPGPSEENWPGVSVYAAIVNFPHPYKYGWKIRNHVLEAQLAEQAKQKAAEQRAAAEQQRQVQLAAKAEVEKKAAEREKSNDTLLDRFVKRHSLADKKPTGLVANPFAFEGDRLFLVTQFQQMQSATTGLFFLPNEGVLIVTDIPKSAFTTQGKVLLAAKVLGNVRFDGVVGGGRPVNGMIPNLKYLGAIVCRDQNCNEMEEK